MEKGKGGEKGKGLHSSLQGKGGEKGKGFHSPLQGKGNLIPLQGKGNLIPENFPCGMDQQHPFPENLPGSMEEQHHLVNYAPGPNYAPPGASYCPSGPNYDLPDDSYAPFYDPPSAHFRRTHRSSKSKSKSKSSSPPKVPKKKKIYLSSPPVILENVRIESTSIDELGKMIMAKLGLDEKKKRIIISTIEEDENEDVDVPESPYGIIPYRTPEQAPPLRVVVPGTPEQAPHRVVLGTPEHRPRYISKNPIFLTEYPPHNPYYPIITNKLTLFNKQTSLLNPFFFSKKSLEEYVEYQKQKKQIREEIEREKKLAARMNQSFEGNFSQSNYFSQPPMYEGGGGGFSDLYRPQNIMYSGGGGGFSDLSCPPTITMYSGGGGGSHFPPSTMFPNSFNPFIPRGGGSHFPPSTMFPTAIPLPPCPTAIPLPPVPKIIKLFVKILPVTYHVKYIKNLNGVPPSKGVPNPSPSLNSSQKKQNHHPYIPQGNTNIHLQGCWVKSGKDVYDFLTPKDVDDFFIPSRNRRLLYKDKDYGKFISKLSKDKDEFNLYRRRYILKNLGRRMYIPREAKYRGWSLYIDRIVFVCFFWRIFLDHFLKIVFKQFSREK